MKIDLSLFSAAFFEEAEERLVELEDGLLVLERTPGDSEQLNSIFRAAHSIKGASSTFGFTDVARFTHTLEGLLDEVRSGQRALSGTLPELLLRATDSLRKLVAAAKSGEGRPAGSDEVLAELVASTTAGGTAPVVASQAADEGPAQRDVTITFTPAADVFLSGGDPLLVLRELAGLGTVLESSCDRSALSPLAELDPERCALSFTMRLRTSASEAMLRDVFCFVEDGARIDIVEPVVAHAAAQPERPRTTDGQPVERRADDATSIRVAADKIDKLIDLVGEMAITQSMLMQSLEDPSPAGVLRLREAVLQMERNTREMQERVMAVRMVPMGTVIGRFQRVVRDLAAHMGKQITLEISGEDVELDKGVCERISDPLNHLVRNAADHGLETPDERRAAGKPEMGTLHIRARQQGSNVVIDVSDDGRGLDLVRIRAKGIERGLIAADATPSDAEIRGLIFAPGFSTKEQVTDVSGRGVGMDVVKRNIEALHGGVALSDTPGGGTTCTIRLPLTMAILDGLVLRVSNRHFVLPLLSIYESLRPRREDVRTVLGGEVVMLRGEAIPLLRLHRLFGIEPDQTDPCKGLVTVIDTGGTRIALLVDDLIGQAQVVAKSLEKNFHRIDGISGATVLGDGTVALMLDVQSLDRHTGHRQAA